MLLVTFLFLSSTVFVFTSASASAPQPDSAIFLNGVKKFDVFSNYNFYNYSGILDEYDVSSQNSKEDCGQLCLNVANEPCFGLTYKGATCRLFKLVNPNQQNQVPFDSDASTLIGIPILH